MKFALAGLSTLLLLTGLGSVASAGPRDNARGDYVLAQDAYDGRDDGYDRGGDRGDWRDWRGRGQGRWHGGPRDDRRDPDVIPEQRVVRKLVRQGFVAIDDIRLRRDRYIVEAVRPNGALVRLTVDAYDGQILSRERIGWTRDGGGRGGPGWRGPDDLGGGRFGLYGR